VRNFHVLFDDGEASAIEDAAYAPYGKLGFPASPADRPWIYSNFVQSLDGIASFKGRHPTGADISQSTEDRWLTDLLRAHAGGILLGINTLIEETRTVGNRGPLYKIEDRALRELRHKLNRKRPKNIFVTGASRLDLSAFRVFDGDEVDAIIITTTTGAARLTERKPHSHIKVIVAGTGELVDLHQAVRVLYKDFGIRHLLCEGGPTLYGYMSRAGLIDEKFMTVSPVEIGLFVPAEQELSEAEKNDPPKQRPTTFMAPGFVKEDAPWWRWMSCRRIDAHQFNRYRRLS
jgi:riboflavin biosynthesis pyrimidine reductase